jgi:hypothetical protein
MYVCIYIYIFIYIYIYIYINDIGHPKMCSGTSDSGLSAADAIKLDQNDALWLVPGPEPTVFLRRA